MISFIAKWIASVERVRQRVQGAMIACALRPKYQEAGAIIVLLAGTLLLGLYNLATYPAPWFDEGWYLHIARNLAIYGQYATLSSEGFRYDDTALAVAPTLYLPIALVFRWVGVGLVQARLIMVAYLLLATVMFYLVARAAGNYVIAVIATYLFLTHMEDDLFTSTIYLGRQVMGEVPALCFFLAGCLLWFRALTVGRARYTTSVGFLFGLAVVTKLQFIFFIVPTLSLFVLLAHVQPLRPVRKPAIEALVSSLVVIAAWYAVLWAVLGSQNLVNLVKGLLVASSPQVRVFSIHTLGESIKFILRSDFLVFGLPAVFYTLWRAVRRGCSELRQLFLGAFILTGWSWYMLASVGWPRYAYPFLAISNVFTAHLFYDLGDFSSRGLHNTRAVAVMLVMLFLPLSQFRLVGRGLLAPSDSGFQEFTAYIRQNVPQGHTIETWEWEVTFVDDVRLYHLPPTSLLNTLIQDVYGGGTYQPTDYDFRQFNPDYIVVGRFARWTGLYPRDFLERGCRRLAAIGEYELFEVIGE